uniref:ZP domain-containing protein n=1 Tax=Eptatretus burgeri TaxID=7764 RepID=A0A8C4QQB6_EPTBU
MGSFFYFLARSVFTMCRLVGFRSGNARWSLGRSIILLMFLFFGGVSTEGEPCVTAGTLPQRQPLEIRCNASAMGLMIPKHMISHSWQLYIIDRDLEIPVTPELIRRCKYSLVMDPAGNALFMSQYKGCYVQRKPGLQDVLKLTVGLEIDGDKNMYTVACSKPGLGMRSLGLVNSIDPGPPPFTFRNVSVECSNNYMMAVIPRTIPGFDELPSTDDRVASLFVWQLEVEEFGEKVRLTVEEAPSHGLKLTSSPDKLHVRVAYTAPCVQNFEFRTVKSHFTNLTLRYGLATPTLIIIIPMYCVPDPVRCNQTHMIAVFPEVQTGPISSLMINHYFVPIAELESYKVSLERVTENGISGYVVTVAKDSPVMLSEHCYIHDKPGLVYKLLLELQYLDRPVYTYRVHGACLCTPLQPDTPEIICDEVAHRMIANTGAVYATALDITRLQLNGFLLLGLPQDRGLLYKYGITHLGEPNMFSIYVNIPAPAYGVNVVQQTSTSRTYLAEVDVQVRDERGIHYHFCFNVSCTFPYQRVGQVLCTRSTLGCAFPIFDIIGFTMRVAGHLVEDLLGQGYSLRHNSTHTLLEVQHNAPHVESQTLQNGTTVRRLTLELTNDYGVTEKYLIVCPFSTAACMPDGMMVFEVWSKSTTPPLNLSAAHLPRDPSCKPISLNDERAIFSFPISACGTQRSIHNGKARYSNEVVAFMFDSSTKRIARNSEFRLTVMCEYLLEDDVKLTVMSQTVKPPLPVEDRGPLRLNMRLFQDGLYNSAYQINDFPVVRVLRQPVFLQVEVMGRSDPALELFLDDCWATNTADATSQPQWDVVTDGCPSPGDNYPTVLHVVVSANQLQHPLSHYKRFEVKAFVFMDTANMPLQSTVYFHCSAVVCDTSHPDLASCQSNCAKPFTSDRMIRRRGRSVQDVQGVFKDTISLNNPIIVDLDVMDNKLGEVPQQAATLTTRSHLIAAFVACVTFALVFLAGGLFMLSRAHSSMMCARWLWLKLPSSDRVP